MFRLRACFSLAHLSFMSPAIGAAGAGGAKPVRILRCSSVRLRRSKRSVVHGRAAFHQAATDYFFGDSAIFSQQDAHLSWPHLSQQSPPCVQQEEQSFVAFIFGCVSSASTGNVAKAHAMSASFSVVFMVVVFSLVEVVGF
jgi:hypothetical protein